jgi:hypothetical protein
MQVGRKQASVECRAVGGDLRTFLFGLSRVGNVPCWLRDQIVPDAALLVFKQSLCPLACHRFENRIGIELGHTESDIVLTDAVGPACQVCEV